jgi:hypothetical protein
MSNQVNTNLIERANELLEELSSHPAGLDKAIQAALDRGDLEELHYAVGRADAALAQEHFYNNDILGDVF